MLGALAFVALFFLLLGVARSSAAANGEIEQWGTFGIGPGELLNPRLIGVDPIDGSTYIGGYEGGPSGSNTTPVTNASDLKLQKFSSEGSFEGMVEIPRTFIPGSEEFFDGIAVDHDRGLIYLLVVTHGIASKILAFSTTPNAQEELVPAAEAELPVPDPAVPSEALATPEGFSIDPSTGDLLILAHDAAASEEPSIVQRISPAGIAGARKELPSPKTSPGPGAGRYMAVGPDGTVYVVENGPRSGNLSELGAYAFELSPDFAQFREVPGFREALLRERVGEGGAVGYPNPNGGFGGPQIAVSPDGKTLYWKHQAVGTDTSPSVRGETTVRAFSLADHATTTIFGASAPSTEPEEPFNETCVISGFWAPIVAEGGGRLVVLDPGSVVSPEGAEEGEQPEYGMRVMTFGPGGSCTGAESVAPQPLMKLEVGGSEVEGVQAGAHVLLDPTASELAGAEADNLGWQVEGPTGTVEQFPEAVTPPTGEGTSLPTLDHVFLNPGTYTVRLNLEGTEENAQRYGKSWGAPSKRLAVGVPAVTTTFGTTARTSTEATVAGTVDPNEHSVSNCVIEYGPTTAYGSTKPCSPAPSGAGTSAQPVSATLTGLSPSTAYHFRVVAENGEGKGFGEDEVLATAPAGGTEPTPVVSKIEPAKGPAAGGTVVTITGEHLTGAIEVKFGAVAATDVVVVSDAKVEATAPAGAAGSKVTVTVVTRGGPSAPVAADEFEYEQTVTPTPVVSKIEPAEGPAAGGTVVTITGEHLTGAIEVKFGAVAATDVVVVSDAKVEATAPAGAAGSKVTVTVVTRGGPSAPVAADEFEYEQAHVVAKFALTVSKAGTGSGSVSSSPAGIDCGGGCTATFTEGTTVTLTATPASGSTFAGWGGAWCSGTGTCVVSLTTAKTVTATFNAIPSTPLPVPPGPGPTPKPTPTPAPGKVTPNKGAGTATLAVTVAGSGKLVASGKGVAKATATVKGGKASILVKATGPALKTLNKKGKVSLKVTLTFTPSGGGAPVTVTKTVLLKKTIHHHG